VLLFPAVMVHNQALYKNVKTLSGVTYLNRCQWPRGLRPGSAVTRWLGLRVLFPRGERMLFSCDCCVLSGRVNVTGWSLVHRSPTDCGVSKCDCVASKMRRPWPTRGCWAMERNIGNCSVRSHPYINDCKISITFISRLMHSIIQNIEDKIYVV